MKTINYTIAFSLLFAAASVGYSQTPLPVEEPAVASDQPSAGLDAPGLDDLNTAFDATAAEDVATEDVEESSDAGPFGSQEIVEESALAAEDLALLEEDTISVDFPNEEIRTVLRNIADLYMLNLVVPEELQGTTSIKLRDVTWRQIFNVVLEPVNYTFVEDENIIKVVSRDALNFEPPVTEIFMLNYAKAGTVAGTVKSLVDAEKGGRVQVDGRTNGLIVTERSSKMDNIRKVIERLDKPTQQVMIETRFIEVTNRDVKNIGVKWNSLREYNIRAGNLSKDYSRERGSNSGISNVSLNDGGGAGVTGTQGTQNGQLFNNLVDPNTPILDMSSVVRDNLTSLATAKTTTALFSADEFSIAISALEELGDSRLVSNPTIVTLNNQRAEIAIGEQYPIPSYSYNDERGTFEVSGFEYRDIGIVLKVTPSVNDKGLITLSVEPEVSSQNGFIPFGGASGTQVPIIGTRRTKTQISLSDGYTMGIGGLMENRTSDAVTKVPVLGSIPVLGRAFRHKSKDHEKLNLLIFITARILPAEEANFEDVFTSEAMELTGVDSESIKHR